MPMVIQYQSRDFEPAPAGPAAAVCIDVVDLGMRDTPFGVKRKLRIVWAIDKRMKSPDRKTLGKPYIVGKHYTWSLHKKSNLRIDLENWAGKKFKESALVKDGYDVERLLGKPAFLSITHNVKDDGTTYANVTALMPLPDGMHAPLPDPTYVRQKDRSEQDGKLTSTRRWSDGDQQEPPVPDDDEAPGDENADDLPF